MFHPLVATHLTHQTYRADIDGLRAVAVLAVVGFHAFPALVPGGFIGVDVFFVISGFLISTIIFDNLERGSFSFAEFYSRRIRRIFPALTVLFAACYAFGWFRLLTEEYEQLGKHIAAGAAFISNFVFWNEAGYFDNAAETKPLLHLWSLGIEEQFYIAWPFLLWAAWKLRFNALALIVAIGLASFALNVRDARSDTVAAFYSPQTRFWELSCGSAIAWVRLHQPDVVEYFRTKPDAWPFSSVYRHLGEGMGPDILSMLGAASIAYGVFAITKSTPFPGAWALLPTLGASLIILAGSRAWLNRVFLSRHWLVWVGLISYPLYLWHWPLLSFARISGDSPPGTNVRIAAVALSFLLAWLTYKWVEKPLRFGAHGVVKVALLAAMMIGVAALGYETYRMQGLAFRFEKLVPEYASDVMKVGRARSYRDDSGPASSLYVDPECNCGAVGHNESNKVLFVGDSHAFHYRAAVVHLLETSGSLDRRTVLFPVALTPVEPLTAKMFADDSIKTVVFSFFWTLQYGSAIVDQTARLGGAGRANQPILTSAQMDEIDLAFKKVVQRLRSSGKRVHIVLDNPFGPELDPHSVVKRDILRGIRITMPAPLSRSVALARTEPARSRIIRIARETGSRIIDPFEFLCNETTCPAFSTDGEFLYNDYDHLSPRASMMHVKFLDEILE